MIFSAKKDVDQHVESALEQIGNLNLEIWHHNSVINEKLSKKLFKSTYSDLES